MALSLAEFFRTLDGLHSRADLPYLISLLNELSITCEDVAEAIRFNDRGYARNLVHRGQWYAALALCWKNGQRSPIHDHKGSSCGVRVLRGVATETFFEFAPNGLVKAVSSRDLHPGEVCGSQDDDMHQVSNLQAGGADLVTLHVYSPPLISMRTFSLTDDSFGIEPMFMEFCDAAGI